MSKKILIDSFEKRLVNMQSEILAMARKFYPASPDNAQDLAQETMLQILTERKSYKEENNFRGWVYTLMSHIFVDEMRRNVLGATDTADDFESEDPINPENQLLSQDLLNTIHTLPEEQQQTFLLYLDGYSGKEIAEKLHVPEGTVKSRLHNVRIRLKGSGWRRF